MIPPVLRLSGRDTASTPGKLSCSDDDEEDINQDIPGMAGSTTARGRMLRAGLVTASRDISQTGENREQSEIHY